MAERALEVALDRGATLRVRVLDPGDAPVSRAVVELRADARDLSTTPPWQGFAGSAASKWPADTDADGVATWADLPADIALRARVLRRMELVHTEPAEIVLDAGEQRELTWRVAATSDVRGVVREDNGEPAPRRKLWLQRSRGETAVIFRYGMFDANGRSTTSDEAGRFRFRDVPPGAWWLAPAPPEFGRADPVRDPVSVGQRVEVSDSGAPVDADLVLQRGLVIRGRVLAPDGVTPIESSVSARRDGGLFVNVSGNADGEFVLGPLLPGRWKLTASSRLAHRQSERIEVDAGATNVVLRLQPAADVRVRVVDENGAPVSAADVRLSQDRYPAMSFPTDSAGIARSAAWFPEGVGTATCALPDGRWGLVKEVRMRVDAPTEVELRLQPGVRALLRCGATAPRDSIDVIHDGVSVAHALLAPGRVVATTLPVGRVTLRAVVEGAGTIEREFVVEPGTAPEFTFDGAWR